MTDHRIAGKIARQIVLVADSRNNRRLQLIRRAGQNAIIEAASLNEIYPLAEEMAPNFLALSADFLMEPECEGVIRLARMLGSRIFFYVTDSDALIKSRLREGSICVPMEAGDGLVDLLARLEDPRVHITADSGQLELPEMILIGASTGGVSAIETVLASFPSDCPPTLVVQHMRDGFVPGLVQRLNKRCRPRVVEASDGQTLMRGTIYFASDSERHLAVSGKVTPRCALVPSPPRHGHRPAVDTLFESAVPFANRVAAALLTGMGTDGAIGLGALRLAGAHTIAQDRKTSTVWGMPRAAVEAGAAACVLPPDRIGSSLLAGRGFTLMEARGEARHGV